MHARSPCRLAVRLLSVAALGAALAGVASCASTTSAGAGATGGPAEGRQTAALPGKPGCFFLINFEGSWTVLDDSELIVYAPLYNNPYYIKLFEPIPNLAFDQRLGFLDVERTGMICNDAMDDLLVPHWQPHDIPIIAVRQLTPAEADRLLRAHGQASPYHHGNAKAKPPKGNSSAGKGDGHTGGNAGGG